MRAPNSIINLAPFSLFNAVGSDPRMPKNTKGIAKNAKECQRGRVWLCLYPSKFGACSVARQSRHCYILLDGNIPIAMEGDA
jgi:hypothetical protein